MKLLIRTLAFHFICIIFFAFIYYNLADDFIKNKNKNYNYLDFLYLSTTIQSSVGFSDLKPFGTNGKIFLILQQLFMISTHVITIYIFTL